MRFLQFNNVGAVVGGTGACAFTIAGCFPDMESAIYSFGTPSQEFLEVCGVANVKVYWNRISTEEAIEDFKPDFLVFHNTAPNRFPSVDPRTPTIFYQHSLFSASKASRDWADVFFVCSRHLANIIPVDPRFVLHQPVPLAPHSAVPRSVVPTVGRICTPKASKWKLEDFMGVYDHLAQRFPDLRFEFVGAPPPAVEAIGGILGPRASFFDPSWEARWRLRTWWGMLYSSSLEESYGRVVCEAQRVGCVPIVSRLGGFIEQINPGVTGALCQTSEEFGDALELLIEGHYDLPAMKKSADSRGGVTAFRERLLETLSILFAGKGV